MRLSLYSRRNSFFYMICVQRWTQPHEANRGFRVSSMPHRIMNNHGRLPICFFFPGNILPWKCYSLCFQIKHRSCRLHQNENESAWPWCHELLWKLNPEIKGLSFQSDLSMEEQNLWENESFIQCGQSGGKNQPTCQFNQAFYSC